MVALPSVHSHFSSPLLQFPASHVNSDGPEKSSPLMEQVSAQGWMQEFDAGHQAIPVDPPPQSSSSCLYVLPAAVAKRHVNNNMDPFEDNFIIISSIFFLLLLCFAWGGGRGHFHLRQRLVLCPPALHQGVARAAKRARFGALSPSNRFCSTSKHQKPITSTHRTDGVDGDDGL
jgi:hypothetical protein